VSGKELAACCEELKESLGVSMVETIVYDLEVMFNVILEGRFSYKISQIDDALRKLLGDPAAELMMESILKCLGDRNKES
jgi:hypothetical protein